SSFRNSHDGDAGSVGRHAAHVKLLCVSAVIELVESALQINADSQGKGPAVVYVDILATRYVQLIELGSVSRGSGPFALQAAPGSAGFEVYNFERLVGGRRREQPYMLGIDRHVVKPALDAGQRNRLR